MVSLSLTVFYSYTNNPTIITLFFHIFQFNSDEEFLFVYWCNLSNTYKINWMSLELCVPSPPLLCQSNAVDFNILLRLQPVEKFVRRRGVINRTISNCVLLLLLPQLNSCNFNLDIRGQRHSSQLMDIKEAWRKLSGIMISALALRQEREPPPFHPQPLNIGDGLKKMNRCPWSFIITGNGVLVEDTPINHYLVLYSRRKPPPPLAHHLQFLPVIADRGN